MFGVRFERLDQLVVDLARFDERRIERDVLLGGDHGREVERQAVFADLPLAAGQVVVEGADNCCPRGAVLHQRVGVELRRDFVAIEYVDEVDAGAKRVHLPVGEVLPDGGKPIDQAPPVFGVVAQVELGDVVPDALGLRRAADLLEIVERLVLGAQHRVVVAALVPHRLVGGSQARCVDRGLRQ